MKEKEILIDILHQLADERDLSEGMIALLEAGFMDKETKGNLLAMIRLQVKKISDTEKKKKLEEDFLQIPMERNEE